MITDDDAATLKDWTDNVKGSIEGRNKAIIHAIRLGATVPEIVKITGLTRGRIYQINGPKP
jgi:hypothetical protein